MSPHHSCQTLVSSMTWKCPTWADFMRDTLSDIFQNFWRTLHLTIIKIWNPCNLMMSGKAICLEIKGGLSRQVWLFSKWVSSKAKCVLYCHPSVHPCQDMKNINLPSGRVDLKSICSPHYMPIARWAYYGMAHYGMALSVQKHPFLRNNSKSISYQSKTWYIPSP